MKIVHIIPTFNERENIGRMIEAIETVGKKYPSWKNEILIVDDYSPDGTGDVVRQISKTKKNVYLLEKKKEGLGKALVLGYDYAIKNLHADVVIPNDADFQWDPGEFPNLVKKIEEGYDVAVASRHVPGGSVIGWNWFRTINHEVSNTFLAWWVAGVREVHDHAGNFKAIRVKNMLDRVPLHKMRNIGFSFQLHILYELSKVGATFCEVPVVFRERRFGISKIGLNRYYFRDVVEYVKNSFQIRADRSRRFVHYMVVGVVGFTFQTLLSKFFIMVGSHPGFAVAVGAEGAIISNFFINNHWTFRSHKITGLRVLKKLFHFNLVSVGSIMVQSLIVSVGTHLTGPSTWFLWMVGAIVVVVIPYSYFTYTRLVWKSHKKPRA